MGDVIHINFEGECAACIAEKDRFNLGPGGHVLTLLLLFQQGYSMHRVCEDLCSRHKHTLEEAYQDWASSKE